MEGSTVNDICPSRNLAARIVAILAGVIWALGQVHGAAVAEEPARSSPHPQLAPNVTVLVDAEASKALLPCSRAKPSNVDRVWLPSVEDVMDAEKHLFAYFETADSRFLAVDRYYRQYIGIVRGEEKLLYIHAFSTLNTSVERVAPSWRTVYVPVCDAGHLSWGAEYSIERKVIQNLIPDQGLTEFSE